MIEYTAIWTALAFLYAYAVLSSIEFGASVFQVWPQLLGRGAGTQSREALRTYLSPVWEVTPVFLVTFTVALFTLFPGATQQLGTGLLVNLFVALVLFGIRTLCMLLILYGNVSNSATVNWLLLATSFGTPVALSTAAAYVLTCGEPAGAAAVYLALGALVAAGALFVASTFFRWYASSHAGDTSANKKITTLVHRASGAWFFFAALYALSLYTYVQHVNFAGSGGVVGAVGIASGAAILVYGEKHSRFFASFVASCVLLASAFFASAALQLPYILYPNTTIQDSFTGEATFKLFAVALAIGVAVLAPSLTLLYKVSRSRSTREAR